ncbi:hypothetical protein L226DRAFT_105901 [Lentinus tigrinus ALCF2SS1-7]|uniref:uncharacterized protein n=1 Tax=Lentinus tigrinus ALCF2SS1-7 TaxID=1328758 RepID=UPI0011660CE2|nr:hypothetical protein L226DRAFT_105901 [Lentinus tigrinus ALCF2SS1-7]
MSSDAAALIAFYDRLYAQTYCILATGVLFIYDALITFDREVLYFWTARWTGASLLFVVNRYISMTLYVMGSVGFTFSNELHSVLPGDICVRNIAIRPVGSFLCAPYICIE